MSEKVDYVKHSASSNYCFALRYLKKYYGRKYLVQAPSHVVLSVLVPFASMALPSIIVGVLTKKQAPETMLLTLVLIAGAIQLLHMIQVYVSDKIHQTLFMFRLRFQYEVIEHMMNIEYMCLESVEGQRLCEKAGDAYYCGNDTGIEALMNQFNTLVIQSIGLLLYTGIVGRKNLVILAILLITTGIVAALYFLAEQYERTHKEEQKKESYRFGTLCEESLQIKYAKDIRMYSIGGWILSALHKSRKHLIQAERQITRRYYVAKLCDKILSMIRDVIVYGYFIYQMAKGNLTIDQFLLYIGVAAGFSSWMNGIFNALAEVIRNNIIVDDCRNYMSYGIREEKDCVTIPNKGVAHEIRFENVSFRYENEKEDAIRNLNFTILKGQNIALVGMNGAGKTTLIKLMSGLYQPTEGRILIDGIDLEQLPRKEYWRELSVVFQDVFAFSFSLEDNVTCTTKEQAEQERFEESLRKADLLERVRKLPNKQETLLNKEIDPEGVTLSGGEMQKLMLARALYKDAPMIFLDEPTAALDPIAESKMYERYHKLTKDKTSVFISHRLSSTKFCDRILFMKDGRIVEDGTHEDLLKQDGEYANMFWVQSHYYQEEERKDA